MTFPDWAFIANMIVALGPFYVSLIVMGLLVKRKMDAILSPIQNNPLVRNVLWPLISATRTRQEKSEKMQELGQRGVLARQIKVAETEDAMVRYAGDPAKGFLVPILDGFGSWAIDNFGGSLPKAYRDRMKAQLQAEIPAAVELIPGNVTSKLGDAFVKQLEQRKPELAQELKAWLKLQESEKIGSS